jgi:serine/threonine-protein kinase
MVRSKAVVTDSHSRRTVSFPPRIGRYDLLLPIASGGMATVYLATTRGPMGFEAEVALKLTHPHLVESTEFSADLLEEAKLAVRIRHRNVAAVIDADVDPLGVYLVMEYVEGDTLSGLTKSTPLMPKRMALRVLLDALAGLHAAHELQGEHGEKLNVVHRDFTPHNILVGTDGVARLTDFGVAKAASRLGHTRTGFIKGKIGYMSPEQAKGAPLDRRCDVWAAGVIAWELLAGRRLFTTEDDVATLLKVVTEEPPRLRTIDPTIHPDVEEAVAAALDRNLETRCPSAQAFARRLGVACRPHVGLAEPEEVAEWIAFVVGPRLEARREDARARRSQIASEAMATSGAAPVARPVVEEASAKTAPALGEPTVREVPAQRTLAAPTVKMEPRAPAPVARSTDEPTRTDTSSVVSRAPPPRRGSLRTRVIAIGAATSAAVLVALFAGWRAMTPATPAAPATTASAPPVATPTIAPVPSAIATSPAPTSSAWTAIVPVEALPESPVPSASTPTPRPRGPGRPPWVARPQPAPATGPAPLASSPY